jgi:capsular exopolysaccharide synthesis family protein
LSALQPDPNVLPQQFPGIVETPETHLSDYWEVVWKRRVLVLVCVVVATAIAVLNAFLATPLYRSTVSINVERDRGSPVDLGNQNQVYPDWWNPEFLPTQVRLMKSRAMAERVVKRLNLAEHPDFSVAQTQVPRSTVKGAPVKPSESEPDPQAMARLSSTVLGGIEVNPVRGTSLVELSYVSSSRKLAADVANAVADAYIDWVSEAKYSAVGQASQFLTTQIEQIKSELDEAERRLQAYGRQKDIVSVDPNTNVTLQKLETLTKDYSQAMADRVSKEARYNEMQTAKPEAIADSLSGGLVSQLHNDVLRLEREYADKLNTFKPEWPAMQQLKSQIIKTKQHEVTVIQETVAKAREQAKAEYQMALRKEEGFKQVLNTQKSEAMTLSGNAVEYNNLKVEASTKRTLLDVLLRRQSEMEIASRFTGRRESSIRIVDRALEPGSRFRPSYRRNATLGLFLGLAAGLGLAFFLEYMDRSIRTPEQVERYLALPPLGVVPAVGASGKGYGYGKYGYGYAYARRTIDKLKTKQKPATASMAKATDKAEKPNIELHPHVHPRSTISEAYRTFRTALLLSRAGGVKSFVITSTFPGEGKTSTSANLAVVLGQLGKKVLLIDGDLHKPRLHEVFRVSNRVGLVSVLAENLEPGKAVQETGIPNLFILPAGPISPNPSGLLSSDAMSRLLEVTTRKFDYVVIDSPPVNAVADAIVLGSLTDGVVLCVKGGKTAREQVARARDKLYLSQVRILGVLINQLYDRGPSYGKYYYYQPSYAGYTQEPDDPASSGNGPDGPAGSNSRAARNAVAS